MEATLEKRKLIDSALVAGSPQDQVRQFYYSKYIPLAWQWKFHAIAREADKSNGPVRIGVGGARGPGKSHCVFAQIALDDCQRVPGLKALFLRQTGKAASESFEDLIVSVIASKISYKYTQGVLRFPNGSRILLGGFETERDIDKYIGINYDLIAVEELNQLTEEKLLKLLGSMRTSKDNWRPRFYASFNPGNIGHAFVKSWFVDPHYENRQRESRFVPATYKDNPYLNPEYVQYLETLPGQLGKAWREGSFDVFEGQYFTEWDRQVHVVEPFVIPPGWIKYRAYDHGRLKPACLKWYAVDYDGNVYCYRELYVAGLNVDECAVHQNTEMCSENCPRKGIANEINKLSKGEDYQFSVADPSIFHKTGFVDRFGGQTIAESFARAGVVFWPASNRRVDGWNLMHQYLAWGKDRLPKLRYFNTCFNSIRTIPLQIHDEHKPEDLATQGEDHAVDCDRYFLITLHDAKAIKPKTSLEKELEAIKTGRAEGVGVPNFNEFYMP